MCDIKEAVEGLKGEPRNDLLLQFLQKAPNKYATVVRVYEYAEPGTLAEEAAYEALCSMQRKDPPAVRTALSSKQ